LPEQKHKPVGVFHLIGVHVNFQPLRELTVQLSQHSRRVLTVHPRIRPRYGTTGVHLGSHRRKGQTIKVSTNTA
jgi:hypothetical protein